MAAGALGLGSSLLTRAGPSVTVSSLEWQRAAGGYTVYNFTVSGDHSYFVGKDNGGAWVHNICRISPVAPDWAVKGAHVMSNGVELAVRPGMDRAVVFKPVFSGEWQSAVDAAIEEAQAALQNPEFRARLTDRVRAAIPYVRNYPNDGGLGRSGELHFLPKALER